MRLRRGKGGRAGKVLRVGEKMPWREDIEGWDEAGPDWGGRKREEVEVRAEGFVMKGDEAGARVEGGCGSSLWNGGVVSLMAVESGGGLGSNGDEGAREKSVCVGLACGFSTMLGASSR